MLRKNVHLPFPAREIKKKYKWLIVIDFELPKKLQKTELVRNFVSKKNHNKEHTQQCAKPHKLEFLSYKVIHLSAFQRFTNVIF